MSYDIEFSFVDNNLNDSQRAVFTDAGERWEQIITKDLPPAFVRGFGLVDDLVIEVRAPFIDGQGNVLGQAGPTQLRRRSFLPAAGIMEFDIADLSLLEQEGLLEDVILHEMAHVIGFGTIWPLLQVIDTSNPGEPIFLGEGAIAEYEDLLGTTVVGIPLEESGGSGTALRHWDEELFDNELMTGFINFGENPLSRLTAASIEDLGYQININAADEYSLPSSNSSTNASLIEPKEIVGKIIALDIPLETVESFLV